MTTKTIPAATLTSEVISEAAQNVGLPTTPTGKPTAITLVGHSYRILAQFAALARQGYTLNASVPVNLFPATGQIELTLALGDPATDEVDEAAKVLAEAFKIETYKAEQDAKAVASLRAEELERVAKQAALAAQIAEAEKVVRALKRQIDKVAA